MRTLGFRSLLGCGLACAALMLLSGRPVAAQSPAAPAQQALARGAAALKAGDHARAAAALREAVRLQPKNAQARLLLAKAYERSDDWLGVVEQYRTLCELAPQEAEYAYRLGRAYARLSEWSQAQMLKLNPRSARVQQMLGHSYRAQGKPELAVKAFRRAAERDPKLAEVHLMLALILLEQKRLDEALTEIEAELKLVPESQGALRLKQQIQAARAAP